VKRPLFAFTAVVCGAAALAPPMDRLADASFAWHMGQHLVLLYAVPLFVLLAHPFDLFARWAGKRATAVFVRATRPLHAAGSIPFAFAFATATLWGVHFSGLYEAALQNRWLHAGEHALLLTAGTFFWLPVLGTPPLRPYGYPARIFYLMLMLPQGALLAMALGSTRAPLYAHYAAIMPVAQAVADQRNGAAVMWIGGGAIVLCALLATLGVWASREARTMAAAAALAFGIVSLGVRSAEAAVTPPPHTARQARVGQTLYYENCAECHGAALNGNFGPALAGNGANVQWDTMKYLWSYITAHMPAGNAGGLSKDDYVDIMAFLLQMHGHPPSRAPLTPEAASTSKAYLGP
jgi:putative membrane protein